MSRMYFSWSCDDCSIASQCHENLHKFLMWCTVQFCPFQHHCLLKCTLLRGAEWPDPAVLPGACAGLTAVLQTFSTCCAKGSEAAVEAQSFAVGAMTPQEQLHPRAITCSQQEWCLSNAQGIQLQIGVSALKGDARFAHGVIKLEISLPQGFMGAGFLCLSAKQRNSPGKEPPWGNHKYTGKSLSKGSPRAGRPIGKCCCHVHLFFPLFAGHLLLFTAGLARGSSFL